MLMMPTIEDIEHIARATLAGLAPEFRARLADIVLQVHEFATPEQLDAVGVQSQWNLAGLYEGRPVNRQSSWDSGSLPPVISLFRQPLLREWQEVGGSFEAIIRHVTIHEAGHHFGFSDDDMHALEEGSGDI